MEKGKVIILCAAIAATACLVTGLIVYYYSAAQERGNEIRIGDEVSGNYQNISKYMEIGDLEKMINDNYYENVEEDELVAGAMKGMVDSLGDPYSTYFTEEEYNNYIASSEGTYVGVGIAVAPVNGEGGTLKVVRTYKGGPAQSAGIAEGDVIVAVNGQYLGGMDFENANTLISGPNGSSVTLTTQSQGQQQDITLVRAKVQTPFVFYSMLDDQVGNIIISEFKGDCVAEFKEYLNKLVEEEEAQGIVIDLRDNMGGSVKSAQEILDMIMPEGLLAYSIDKTGGRNELVSTGKYNDLPIAVIVNGGTASASEIFAGAVQDNGRGPVIGTQTFGKGVAQIVEPMPYSSGAVKLTTATYFTPNGNEINEKGITPNQEVQMPADVSSLTAETDTQLQAAREAVREAIG